MSIPVRPHWSNHFGFLMAAAGSAIGLGNIWKFPYITGVNGGGGFVLIYLICVIILGLPILLAELYLGSQSQRHPVNAYCLHNPSANSRRWQDHLPWQLGGYLGLAAALMILSFYSVVGGWILNFTWQFLRAAWFDTTVASEAWPQLLNNTSLQIANHGMFMLATTIVVIGGIQRGLEAANRIMMPLLLILLLGLLVLTSQMPGLTPALDFLFGFHWEQLTSRSLIEAAGHAFFTLSLGMGAMMIYGSYLAPNQNLLKLSLILVVMDTSIALIAGMVIFSVVFSFDLEPAAGPGLIFQTLPALFNEIPGGLWMAVVFFCLVVLAAWSSAVSILEVPVSYLTENLGMTRTQATLTASGSIFGLGLLHAASGNELKWLSLFGFGIFDIFDHISTWVLLPTGALITTIYAGHALQLQDFARMTGFKEEHFVPRTMRLMLAFLAPLAILILMLTHLIL